MLSSSSSVVLDVSIDVGNSDGTGNRDDVLLDRRNGVDARRAPTGIARIFQGLKVFDVAAYGSPGETYLAAKPMVAPVPPPKMRQ
jgi:hypothetical protein